MVTIVLPAYDEKEAIVATIREVRSVLESSSIENFEILVVDDGSSDGTGELAEAEGARVIRHPENVGYGRSLKDGISAAHYDTIVICDADGSYPADRIPDLLSEFDKGFDMVVGARENHRDWFGKAMMRKTLRWLVEYTSGRRIPDVNSGMRVFSKETSMPHFNTLCDTFSFTTSLTLAYAMSSRFVAYVPIEYRPRTGKSKISLFSDSAKTLQYIVQTIIYHNPLKIFLLFSLLCILLATIGFIGSATLGLQSGFLLGIGGLLVALLVFSLGLLADLLKQILEK
jgi:glycosyltransferase involved in cell wall biosynthesis